MVRCGSDLPAPIKRKLMLLLNWCHHVYGVFLPMTAGSTFFDRYSVEIPTTSDEPYHVGNNYAWRKITALQRQNLLSQMEEMVASGKAVWYDPKIHKQPWVHSCCYVTKPGDPTVMRFAANYIPLNNRTIKIDTVAQPTLNEVIQRLAGHELHCKLDGSHWFFQFAIHPDHIHKTGVLTPKGILLMKVMTQGHVNSPPIGHTAMEEISEPFLYTEAPYVKAGSYHDDSGLVCNDDPIVIEDDVPPLAPLSPKLPTPPADIYEYVQRSHDPAAPQMGSDK